MQKLRTGARIKIWKNPHAEDVGISQIGLGFAVGFAEFAHQPFAMSLFFAHIREDGRLTFFPAPYVIDDDADDIEADG